MNYKIHSFLIAVAFVALSIPAITFAATLYRQLDIGMSGADVTSLQTFLAADPSLYPEGLVTGYFGNLTSAAVSRFQTRNGISSVGRVGPITLVALNAQMNGGSTVGYDRSAPVIGPLSISTTATTASISWNTSENAAAMVYYSTSPIGMMEAGPSGANSAVTISGTNIVVHLDLRSTHAALITGLQANTTYSYVVYVRDGSGNESITWPSTLRTSN